MKRIHKVVNRLSPISERDLLEAGHSESKHIRLKKKENKSIMVNNMDC